jgi:hypothetical protein
MLCILSLGIDWIAISIDHSSRIQSNTSYSPASVDLLDRFIYLYDLGLLFFRLDLYNSVLWCNSDLIFICHYDGHQW